MKEKLKTKLTKKVITDINKDKKLCIKNKYNFCINCKYWKIWDLKKGDCFHDEVPVYDGCNYDFGCRFFENK